MNYRDKKTGAVISCDSILSGDWVLLDGESEQTLSANKMTTSELKIELEKRGISYPHNAKKTELLALLNEV
ncbi:hypothetical protein KG091_07770 [Carnobacteriaceae bacterium zg-ZUI78]|nr:hypothetical protein [Carnobacteriaceae bacterium zg-ZUI78]